MVKLRSSQGFSLVELIFGMAIFAFVVGGFSMALSQMFKGLAKSGQDVDQQLSSTVLQTLVNRKLVVAGSTVTLDSVRNTM